MEAFIDKKIPKQELIVLNNCRIYFKVIYLSEICDAESTEIRPMYLHYSTEEKNNGSELKWKWPEQAKPGEKSFLI
jgi:hypothetical protein